MDRSPGLWRAPCDSRRCGAVTTTRAEGGSLGAARGVRASPTAGATSQGLTHLRLPQDNEGMAVEEQRRPGSHALRPPAMVTDFMSQGSLKTALSRKADVVQGAMHRLCIAMDAAKARRGPIPPPDPPP